MKREEEYPILRDYAQGTLTWRQASDMLGLDDFNAFEATLGKYGLRLYEPGAETSERTMAALDALLEQGL